MGISIWQIALVLLVVLIVFGIGKLPKVMGDLGKGVKSFKKGLDGEELEDQSKNKSDQD